MCRYACAGVHAGVYIVILPFLQLLIMLLLFGNTRKVFESSNKLLNITERFEKTPLYNFFFFWQSSC